MKKDTKNNKIAPKQKAEVRGYIDKWRSILFLHQWDFQIKYFFESPDPEENGNTTAASILMDPHYKFATLNIHPGFWDETEEYREEIVVHEMCHCLVQPLVELVCDAMNGKQVTEREMNRWKESVTQHVTTAVYWSKT